MTNIVQFPKEYKPHEEENNASLATEKILDAVKSKYEWFLIVGNDKETGLITCNFATNNGEVKAYHILGAIEVLREQVLIWMDNEKEE